MSKPDLYLGPTLSLQVILPHSVLNSQNMKLAGGSRQSDFLEYLPWLITHTNHTKPLFHSSIFDKILDQFWSVLQAKWIKLDLIKTYNFLYNMRSATSTYSLLIICIDCLLLLTSFVVSSIAAHFLTPNTSLQQSCPLSQSDILLHSCCSLLRFCLLHCCLLCPASTAAGHLLCTISNE